MKAVLALCLMIASCASCAVITHASGPSVYLTPLVEGQLRDMIAATTGTKSGHEVGQCLRGYTNARGQIIVTEALTPTWMRGTARTYIDDLQCGGLRSIVGRAHFHPWDGKDGCHRSPLDFSTHFRLRHHYPIDVVVCPSGAYHWYHRDGYDKEVRP
jgi:hypothetical protein